METQSERLETIAQSLLSLLPGASTIAIMLLDETGVLRPVAWAGPRPEGYQTDYQLPPGQGLHGQVILTGSSLYIPHTSDDRRPVEFVPGTQSVLIVPLNLEGQILGALSAASQHPSAFTDHDQKILEMAAAQAATLLENTRLRASASRHAQEVAVFIELVSAINAGQEIEQLFASAHQAISRLMACDAFYISIRDAGTQNASVTHLIDQGVRYPPARWPIEAGLSGYILQSGEQLLVRDLFKETLPFQGVFYGKQDQVRSLIACPLRYPELIKGMLSCQSYQPAAYVSYDLQLLQSIADLLASALKNAELRADLADRYLTVQELERVRSEIIQNVSHELRTPLTFLRSYLELLIGEQLGDLNPGQKHSLDILQARTNTLVRLVDDITTLESFEPGWLQLEEVDLAELAANVLQAIEPLARGNDSQLILEAPKNFPKVQADPDRITQVLDNLLGNALKYGQKASKIVVRLEAEADRATVSVSNQGTGIPSQEQERIFERFYQVNGSISRPQSGLGLGLAIVKRIIEAHHGTVSVQSDLENGSTFTFSLPYRPA